MTCAKPKQFSMIKLFFGDTLWNAHCYLSNFALTRSPHSWAAINFVPLYSPQIKIEILNLTAWWWNNVLTKFHMATHLHTFIFTLTFITQCGCLKVINKHFRHMIPSHRNHSLDFHWNLERTEQVSLFHGTCLS